MTRPTLDPATFHHHTTCRLCGGRDLTDVLDLGAVPLADGLVAACDIDQPEQRFPLTIACCSTCSLLQLRETVDPQLLYCRDYPYYSSFSDTWLAHCRTHAGELIDSCGLDESSLVVEIASNDGYLLRHFLDHRIRVLGIDPAIGPAAAASELGIPVLAEFFSTGLAGELRSEGTRADLILANNVLAHVADMNDLVRGMADLLAPRGRIVIEVPYVGSLVERCEFDTIYHEHHAYFSVTALQRLFDQWGLVLRSVRRLPTHGGSLRLHVDRTGPADDSVRTMTAREEHLGFCDGSRYASFAADVRRSQQSLRDWLGQARRHGRRVAGYAASAKGCSLLNTSGIRPGEVEFAVDRSPHKQGKFIPGVRIPIKSPAELVEQMPDEVLLLAWNLEREILSQQSEYVRRGGRFVSPIPECHVVDANVRKVA